MFVLKYLFSLLLVATMCFLLNISMCHANPGLQVQLTQKGLDYVMEFALSRIHAQLQQYTPPNASKKGWISYDLYNIKVAYVSPPSGKLLLIPNRGLKWSIQIKKYHMKAKLRVSKKIAWFRVRKTYTVGIVLSNINLGLIITPTKTTDGSLYLTATHCTSSIKVNIYTSSIILKIFIKIFKKRFQKKMKSKMCESAVRTVNTHIAETVARYPVSIPIGAGYVFHYGLVSNPAFTSKYLLTNHEGSICKKNQKLNFPFAPKRLPVIYEDNSMIYFIISDFVVNTWLYSSYHDNRMKFKLKTENKYRELFKTTCHKSTCFGSYLPKISQTYPNSKIEAFFSMYKPANVKFNLKQIHMDIAAQLDFFIVQSNGKSVNLLSSRMALFCVVTPTMKHRTIVFTIKNTRVTMGKMSSKLLHIYNLKTIEALVASIIKIFINDAPGKHRGNAGRVTMNQSMKMLVMERLMDYVNSVATFFITSKNNLKDKRVTHQARTSLQLPLVIPQNTLLSDQHLRIVKNAIIVSSNLRILSV